jgi:hypothetical protein
MERRTMMASKFTDAQKAFILRQGEEGVAVVEICRKAGISHADFRGGGNPLLRRIDSRREYKRPVASKVDGSRRKKFGLGGGGSIMGSETAPCRAAAKGVSDHLIQLTFAVYV